MIHFLAEANVITKSKGAPYQDQAMSLSERNVTQSRGNDSVHGDETSRAATQKAHHVDPTAPPDFLAHPSSINSMLRNTTETGDIGVFTMKQKRVPYPLGRTPSGASRMVHREIDYPERRARTLQISHHGADGIRNDSLRSYQDTTTSSVISLYQSESQKSRRPRMQPRYLENDDGHLFSTSQSSLTSYKLSHYHSYASLRSQTPLPYPTRLKRPGYRPSSPALSNFQGTDTRTNVGLDNGTNFRTSTPSSPYAARRRPPAGNQQDLNWSYTPPQNPPMFPFRSGAHGGPSQIKASSMRPPRSISSLSYSSSTKHPGTNQAHDRMQRQQRAPSPSPLYYDYSEAFSEEHHFTANLSVLSLTEQAVAENNIPEATFEVEGDAMISSPAELPELTDNGRTPSDGGTSKSSGPLSKGDCVDIITPSDLQNSKRADSATEHPLNQKFSSASLMQSFPAVPAHHRSDRASPVVSDTMGHHILSSYRSRAPTGSPSQSFRKDSDLVSVRSVRTPKQLPQPKDLFTKLSEFIVNDTVLTSSASSSGAASISGATQEPVTLPKDAHQDGQIIDAQFRSLPDWGADTPDVVRDKGQTAIFAPVPHRSSSSRSQQDRFSRIFSIDDNSVGLRNPSVKESDISSRINETLDCGKQYDTTRSRSVPRSLEPVRESQRIENKTIHSKDSRPRVDPTGRDTLLDRLRDDGGIDLGDTPPTDYPQTSSRAVLHCSAAENYQIRADQTSTRFSQVIAKKDFDVNDNASNLAELSSNDKPKLMKALPSVSVNPQSPTVGNSAPEALPVIPVDSLGEGWVEPHKISKGLDLKTIKRLGPKFKLRLRPIKDSAPSHLISDTLHLDGSQPGARRTNVKEAEEVAGLTGTIEASEQLPKFKLEVTRASTSPDRTISLIGSASVQRPTLATTHPFPPNIFQGALDASRSKSTFNSNSMMSSESLPKPTRSTEFLIERPTTAPTITLVPPSPDLHFGEARSFFSDDSSQLQDRGSLRKRFSQLKAIATRASSFEDLRVPDWKHTNSALGRSKHGERASLQSENVIIGMSHLEYRKMKLMGKLKKWWQVGESKLRDLSGKLKVKASKQRSSSPDLHADVNSNK